MAGIPPHPERSPFQRGGKTTVSFFFLSKIYSKRLPEGAYHTPHFGRRSAQRHQVNLWFKFPIPRLIYRITFKSRTGYQDFGDSGH